MTVLRTWHASAPTDEVQYHTVEINIAGQAPIRIVRGYENMYFGVDGVMRLFEAGGIELALPAKNTTGQQRLNFTLAGIEETIQRYIDGALETDQSVMITYRVYLKSDLTEPAQRRLRMEIKGGQLEGDESVFECGFYDLLNAAWPRPQYDSNNAPGLKYL